MGVLITIEGVDGSGKTTQIDLLYNHLRELGYSVIRTREPGGTPVGDQIRKLLLSKNFDKIHPLSELMMFQASRVQLVETVIRPALSKNKIVLCDRFIDSTIAYQGYGRQMGTGLISKMNQVITKGIMPNLTLVLDVDVQQGLNRATTRNKLKSLTETRFDDEEIFFHYRVRNAFKAIAQKNPKRVKLIDASKPVEVVHKRLMGAVSPVLKQFPVERKIKK